MADNHTKSQLLDQLLSSLASHETEQRLTAIAALAELNYSSEAILRRLEVIALNDPSPEVQQAANNVLSNSVYRHTQFQLSRLPASQRAQILAEINTWVRQGLIEPQHAEIISLRYNFDMRKSPAPQPAVPQPAAPASIPPAASQTAHTPTQTAPSPGLLQTLTSEASIKIWLYLGAFFVIAAALILAALVELLRTPILFSTTLLFGAGALALKKRLLQPSFTLWIVASALGLITAQVIGNSLTLSQTSQAGYWFIILLIFTAIWYLSTRLYESRFFTLVMSAAWLSATWQLARFFSADFTGSLLSVMSGVLLLLPIARHFMTWRGRSFAEPMLIALALGALSGLGLFGLNVLDAFFDPKLSASWAAAMGTGAVLFGIFIFLNSLLPLSLPLWAAAGALALTPLGWLFSHILGAGLTQSLPPQWGTAVGIWVWGVILAVIGELAAQRPNTTARQFATPLVLAALINLLFGPLMDANNAWLLLGLSAGSAMLLTLMFARNTRWWVWSASLFAWVLTYIAFWRIPALSALDINDLYKAVGLAALLALADWLRPGDFRSLPAWRWPLRTFFAMIITFASVSALLFGFDESIPSSLTYAAFSALFLAYALRFNQPALGIGFTFFGWAALNSEIIPLRYVLQVTLLAVTYYITGFYLPRREERPDWSRLLRWSGLAVALIIPLVLIFDTPAAYDGALVIIAAGLFIIESCRYIRWMELPAHLLIAIASIFLVTRNSLDWELTLLGVTVLPLWLDFAYTRLTSHTRPWRIILLTAVGGFATLGAIITFAASPLTALILSISTALTLLALALLYRHPKTGYAFYIFLTLITIHALRYADIEQWSPTLIALAALIYAHSWLDKPTGWSIISSHSGLALGTLTAFLVPLQNAGLLGSIPVTVAATLWGVHAFRRRNVWLGFPTNALYLMAYFIILIELNVDQPQFFSVGAAVLGMLMHYLLLRAGANTGAFITGMVSQLVLLSTTYLQMVATNSLAYFAALFFQSLAVLVYGLIIRSRSLVFTPIVFVVLGVITVVFSVLKGIATVILIGCTGILFILLGIGAVLMRERITELRGRLNDWKA